MEDHFGDEKSYHGIWYSGLVLACFVVARGMPSSVAVWDYGDGTERSFRLRVPKLVKPDD
jgi:hypothetical protein